MDPTNNRLPVLAEEIRKAYADVLASARTTTEGTEAELKALAIALNIVGRHG